MGLILTVVVHAAGIQDYDGLKLVFGAIWAGSAGRDRWPIGSQADDLGVACWRPACPIRLQIVDEPSRLQGASGGGWWNGRLPGSAGAGD